MGSHVAVDNATPVIGPENKTTWKGTPVFVNQLTQPPKTGPSRVLGKCQAI
jgi:hypothetical protein